MVVQEEPGLGYAMINREQIRWFLLGDAKGSARHSLVHECFVISDVFWYFPDLREDEQNRSCSAPGGILH